MAELREAIGVCAMFFLLGVVLGIGNVKLESDRRERKREKVRARAVVVVILWEGLKNNVL